MTLHDAACLHAPSRACLLVLALAAGLVTTPARAQEDPAPQGPTTELTLKVKPALELEGARDLGLADADENSVGFIEIEPAVHWVFTPDFGALLKARASAASDEYVQTVDDRPVPAQEYAQLREAWIEYGGITTFPGEVLRMGLQRVREADGLWWDRDIESVRWIFDTTLVTGQLGVARQFDTYRTDDVDVSPSQRDRAYVFGGYSTQWVPNHFLGLRGAVASDLEFDRDEAASSDPDAKRSDRQYYWVALRLENGYYNFGRVTPFAYWIEGVAMGGDRESASTEPGATPDDPPTVTCCTKTSVQALGGDAAMRISFGGAFNIGFAYAFAQGGDSDETFEQTGLQSNRSRYTGTRSIFHRFNEALQADLSNLHVTTAFMSFPGEFNDLSIAAHHFERDDGSRSISADGIDARPDPDNTDEDIGNGFDVVFAHYFSTSGSSYGWDDDVRSNVRLRGSTFQPGKAFGEAAEDFHRVMLEATLWF